MDFGDSNPPCYNWTKINGRLVLNEGSGDRLFVRRKHFELRDTDGSKLHFPFILER